MEIFSNPNTIIYVIVAVLAFGIFVKLLKLTIKVAFFAAFVLFVVNFFLRIELIGIVRNLLGI
jgi:hypothetical protein